MTVGKKDKVTINFVWLIIPALIVLMLGGPIWLALLILSPLLIILTIFVVVFGFVFFMLLATYFGGWKIAINQIPVRRKKGSWKLEVVENLEELSVKELMDLMKKK